MIDALGRAGGFTRIEVASFVRPDVIPPQLADGVEVLGRIDVPDDTKLMVLVPPNSKGLDNALKVRDKFHEVAIFVSGSETHNKKNVNRTVDETMADNDVMAKRIVAEGLDCAAVIATSFGCPFEARSTWDACSTWPNGSPRPASPRSDSAIPRACAIRRTRRNSSRRRSTGCPASR